MLTKWYCKYIEEIIEIDQDVIKVRKETVYKKGYRLKVLVEYSVASQSQVDERLIEVKFWNEQNIKCISFKYIDVDIRLEILHSNNISDIKAKYEILEDKNASDLIEVDRKII